MHLQHIPQREPPPNETSSHFLWCHCVMSMKQGIYTKEFQFPFVFLPLLRLLTTSNLFSSDDVRLYLPKTSKNRCKRLSLQINGILDEDGGHNLEYIVYSQESFHMLLALALRCQKEIHMVLA